jgi:hypothetical protein
MMVGRGRGKIMGNWFEGVQYFSGVRLNYSPLFWTLRFHLATWQNLKSHRLEEMGGANSTGGELLPTSKWPLVHRQYIIYQYKIGKGMKGTSNGN